MLHAIIVAAAAGSPSAPAAVQRAATAIYDSHAVSSVAYALVENGKIKTSNAVGAPADAAYNIGSVTKMFTAVSVMQLVEQHKLGLDDTLGTLLPQYGVWKTITVRELLTHTSGIPDYADEAVGNGSVQKPTTPSAILAGVAAKAVDFAPGTDWSYSNTNYVLLGQIVEKLSGLPLAQYERKYIYAPAGMHNTWMATAPAKALRPVPYTKDPLGSSPGDMTWYYACGDILASAADVARFDIALMDGKLVKASTFALMQQTARFDTDFPPYKTGLGLYVRSYGRMSLVEHHGGEPGYRADNILAPQQKFAVVVVGAGAYDTSPIVNAALLADFPADTKLAAAQTPPMSAFATDPDPVLTQKLTGALSMLLSKGTVENAVMSPEMIAALTPAEVTAIHKQYGGYGEFQALRYVKKGYASPYKLFIYAATFSKKSTFITIALDHNGKISGLQIR